MKRLKYAGLCAAGISLNMCCLVLDVFLVVRIYDSFYNIGYILLPVGVVLCGASGFVHSRLRNVIRKRLGMRALGYSLAVFIIPGILGLCGMLFAFFPGLDLVTGLSLLIDSALVAGACLISGVSTILFERHLGYDEQESVSKEGEQ